MNGRSRQTRCLCVFFLFHRYSSSNSLCPFVCTVRPKNGLQYYAVLRYKRFVTRRMIATSFDTVGMLCICYLLIHLYYTHSPAPVCAWSVCVGTSIRITGKKIKWQRIIHWHERIVVCCCCFMFFFFCLKNYFQQEFDFSVQLRIQSDKKQSTISRGANSERILSTIFE